MYLFNMEIHSNVTAGDGFADWGLQQIEIFMEDCLLAA